MRLPVFVQSFRDCLWHFKESINPFLTSRAPVVFVTALTVLYALQNLGCQRMPKLIDRPDAGGSPSERETTDTGGEDGTESDDNESTDDKESTDERPDAGVHRSDDTYSDETRGTDTDHRGVRSLSHIDFSAGAISVATSKYKGWIIVGKGPTSNALENDSHQLMLGIGPIIKRNSVGVSK